jgi:hypothetical protein
MRTLFGYGTPRQAADAGLAILFTAVWSALRAIAAVPSQLVGTLLLSAVTYRRAVELAA